MLPPYSYVPGGPWPHPKSNPAGHMFGKPEPIIGDDEKNDLLGSKVFCTAVQLFNEGYYWEAHESWEAVWHASGRTGPVADLVKALIKLAAAGVKVREGRSAGVKTHAERALKILEKLQQTGTKAIIEPVPLQDLLVQARLLASNPMILEPENLEKHVLKVFSWNLWF
jgi:predicted metal-dependent hydrolase